MGKKKLLLEVKSVILSFATLSHPILVDFRCRSLHFHIDIKRIVILVILKDPTNESASMYINIKTIQHIHYNS